MVHTWIRLRNDRVDGPGIGVRRAAGILADSETRFYGDYDFDMYIGTRHDYSGLEAVVAKVIRGGGGWIRNCRVGEERDSYDRYSSLSSVLNEFCWLSEKGLRRLLPRKEDRSVVRVIVVRNDGNFKMIAVETQRLYYVFCFATS